MASEQRLQEARKRLQELRSSQGGGLDAARARLQELRSGAVQTTVPKTEIAPKPEDTRSLKRKIGEGIAGLTGPKELGAGLASVLFRGTEESRQLEEQRATGQDLQTKTLQRIREKRARGEDTSRLEAALAQFQTGEAEAGREEELIRTGGGLTPRQVIGSAVQTGLTIATAGTFGGVAQAGRLGVTGGRILGTGGRFGRRIATGAALGGAFGTAATVREGGEITPKGVAVSAALGAALPVGGAFLRGLGRFAKATPRFLLGDADIAAISQARRFPQEVGRFVSGIKGESGGINLSAIASDAKKAAQSARAKSLATFRGAEEKLPTQQLNKKQIINESNQTIRDTLGLPAKGRISFKGSGLSNSEIRTVRQLQTRIGQWKDFSPAGVNKLRQSIDKSPFFRGTKKTKGADDVVRAITGQLNDTVDTAFEKFSPARARASKDIRFFEALGFNVIGKNQKNVNVTSDKLRTLANLITDRNRKEETKVLLRQFKDRTGFDLEQQLTSFAAAERINRPFRGVLVSGLGGITRSLDTIAVRGLANTARTTGKVNVGDLRSILNRIIGEEQTAIFMAEFNQLPVVLQRELVLNMIASMLKKPTKEEEEEISLQERI